MDDILIYIKTFFHYHIPLTISTYKDVQILADYAGEMFYQGSLSKLDREYDRLCELLTEGRMDELSKECQELSQTIFQHYLNKNIKRTDIAFTLENYKKQFDEFISQVPVVTSTTHAVRKSIPASFVFDYVIIDESSQVDLITAIIAMSCCRNMVIVGDSMQLPQIVPSEVIPQAREYARQMQVHPSYDYVKHSIISSLKAIYSNLPTVLLREHYRCHPLIIDFCNQQFYDKKLIIKSEWTDPKEGNHPLAIVTVRHADRERPCADYKGKSWVNKLEQLKVCEEFNRLTCSGITDIGVITPFRSHANAINKLREDICADTIHKFQGREKEVVIFSTVKDKVKVDEEWESSYSADKRVDFINQSELINVAVSRAKNRLELVMSQLLFEQAPLSTNIGNLIRYIKYNKGEITVLRFDEILDGIVLHARAALIGAVRSIGSRLASERTLDDRSSVVGGILDGFGGSGDSPRGGVVAREYLARHEFHPVVAPRAASHAANADAVVIDGGHRTGHMCPVPRIAFVLAADPDLAIPGDGTARDEVIPVNIVDIAVPVVVGTRSPVFLLRIDPHVRRKVGMRIFHALIHDGNHHAGVTGRDRPGILGVDVGPGAGRRGNGLVAVVVVVPLAGKLRIVEPPRGCGAGGSHIGSRQRSARPYRGHIKLRVELDIPDFGHGGQFQGGGFEVGLLVESHDIPLVQACGTRTLLMAGCVGEHTAQGGDFKPLQHFVDRGNARTGQYGSVPGIAARCGEGSRRSLDGRHGSIVETNDQRPLLGIVRRVDQLRGGCGIRRRIPAVGTIHRRIGGTRRQQQHGEK